LDLYNSTGTIYPSLSNSGLWSLNAKNVNLNLDSIFKDALEELPDEAKKQEMLNLRVTSYSSLYPFNLYSFYLEMQEKIATLSYAQIFDELWRSIELIRQGFMIKAQDIFYVRTGNYKHLYNEFGKRNVDYCYGELPFISYKREFNDFKRIFRAECKHDLKSWVVDKHIIYINIQAEQLKDFFNEEYDKVVEESKKNESYYKLFERCYLCSTSKDNFRTRIARLFYKRPNAEEYLKIIWKRILLHNWLELVDFSQQRKQTEVVISNTSDTFTKDKKESLETERIAFQNETIEDICEFAMMQQDIDHAQQLVLYLYNKASDFPKAKELADKIINHFNTKNDLAKGIRLDLTKQPFEFNRPYRLTISEYENNSSSGNDVYISEDIIAQAIYNINGKDKALKSYQGWLGVCHYLGWMHDFPRDLGMCCKRLSELSYPGALEFECKYENVRKLKSSKFMQETLISWPTFVPHPNEKNLFEECLFVAQALQKEIKKLADIK
jgi:uncharacterized coiled-coil protein SlyX